LPNDSRTQPRTFARRFRSIRRWLRQISSQSLPFLSLRNRFFAVAARQVPGMPLSLLDGTDRRMLAGCVRDAQLIQAAQQSSPIGRQGGGIARRGRGSKRALLDQRALLQMSPGVICRGARASSIPWTWPTPVFGMQGHTMALIKRQGQKRALAAGRLPCAGRIVVPTGT
jgi:hypothetical protein